MSVGSHPYKVSFKRNTNIKDQESLESTSGGHNQYITANLKDLVQSQIVTLFVKCSCSLTDVIEPITWYRWKEEIAL